MKKNILFLFFIFLISKGFASNNNQFLSLFSTRYGSEEMRRIFSFQNKYSTWREVWIALAQAEKFVGLNITQEQIDALKKFKNEIDFEKAKIYESEVHHDVMAHILTYGDQASIAKPIIHLGATSCLITDNADLINIRQASKLVRSKLSKLILTLSQKADRYKKLPCLGYTHFQPAQPVTLGKRFCIWAQDFVINLQNLEYQIDNLKFLGINGATGTQASFLQLFNGDHQKVIELNDKLAELLNFDKILPIVTQTYTRLQDVYILQVLGSTAASAHKVATDFRLLAHENEISEFFSKKQVGSSAMPYKHNPINCENICSLSRYVINLSRNALDTASVQWLERSLDDSANRRLMIPEAFLAIDDILDRLIKVFSNMVVNEQIIKANLEKELPFMITENIIMAGVKAGGDRQVLHEEIRRISCEVYENVKLGKKNNLVDKLAENKNIPLSKNEILALIDADSLVGRSSQQVDVFLNEVDFVLN